MKRKQDLLKDLNNLSIDERMEHFQIEELETRLEMAAVGTGADTAGDTNGTCNGTCTNNGCNDGCW